MREGKKIVLVIDKSPIYKKWLMRRFQTTSMFIGAETIFEAEKIFQDNKEELDLVIIDVEANDGTISNVLKMFEVENFKGEIIISSKDLGTENAILKLGAFAIPRSKLVRTVERFLS